MLLPIQARGDAGRANACRATTVPVVNIDFDDLEAQARATLDPGAIEYYAGAADDEATLADNRLAWRRRRLRPRSLVDVTEIDTSTSVLGTVLPAPMLVAPMAYQRLLHDEGELAVARGASATGTPMIASTMATYSLEDIAAAAGDGPMWFQLYVHENRDFTLGLCHRARDAGYRAIAVTVDMPRLGNRRRARRIGFEMPEVVPNFAVEGGPSGNRYASRGFDVSVTEELLGWLSREAGLPILVKGILRGDDALRSLDAGAAGIIVSNHGGRQLDGAIATADALVEVAEAVGGAAPVIVDSGIRSGTDIVRALAMGAQAVLIGRPVAWALATGGEAGVRAALEALQVEVELAFRLAGVRSVAEITPDLIAVPN
jgi:4-hydroxymandelate oxidase